MPFYEIVFPVNVSYGAIGGQGWSTRVVTTDAGFEFRQQQWDRTRGHWQVAHNLRTPDEWAQLVAFHRVAQGKTFGFRFRDWTDYQDDGQGIFATNSKGTLQLCKLYTVTNIVDMSTITQYRFISKPEPGTVTLPGGVTLDYTTGKVTGGIINQTWTGNFHVPARFDVDDPELSMDIPDGVGWKGIPIVEVRVTDP